MDSYPDGCWQGDPRAPWNAPDERECAECHATLEDDWRYCPWCGTQARKEGD